jgi:hypothetical protein
LDVGDVFAEEREIEICRKNLFGAARAGAILPRSETPH